MGGNGVNSMGADCRREKLLLPTPKLGKYNNGIIRVFRMTDFNRVVLLSFNLEKVFRRPSRCKLFVERRSTQLMTTPIFLFIIRFPFPLYVINCSHLFRSNPGDVVRTPPENLFSCFCHFIIFHRSADSSAGTEVIFLLFSVLKASRGTYNN